MKNAFIFVTCADFSEDRGFHFAMTIHGQRFYRGGSRPPQAFPTARAGAVSAKLSRPIS
jgi:hypothetical protein